MRNRRALLTLSLIAAGVAVLPAFAEENQPKTTEAVDDGKEDAKNGTVIFYRTRSAKGGAIRLNITGSDNAAVGLLTNGSKIVQKVPEGEVTYVVTSPSIAGRDSVTIKVKSGKTYYVKGEAKLGWPAARARFTLMDEAKGKAEADKIK